MELSFTLSRVNIYTIINNKGPAEKETSKIIVLPIMFRIT